MKLRTIVAACAALAISGSVLAQDLNSEKGKISYYFGYDFGTNMQNLSARGEQLDLNAIQKGMQDAYAKKQPAITEEQLRPAIEALKRREQARAEQAKAEYERVAAENKTKSAQFMEQNAKAEGVKELPDGTQYKILQAGHGRKPTATSTVALEVAGPFIFGQRQPEQDHSQQIPSVKISQIEMAAMRDALMHMPVGSKWEITLPPDKAYGADPRTPFPPNVVVQFDVTLKDIKP